jgi:5-methylcytosine-specific restriction endonuclease McrA
VFTHTIDHVVAQANGGTHKADNLTIACGACNSSKRDRQGWNGRKVWA